MHSAIKPEMQAAFESVYDSYWYVMGRNLADFEASYATFCKSKHAIGVSNGLDALFLALKALDIGPGDEVIVPSNTFIATALAVSYVGATPVFAEPDPDTYNLDPRAAEAALTARTKAVMPVHLYGQACDMGGIMRLAQSHGLHVIEDNAQAQGATFRGRLTGSWGDANATSFYPGKNLGALGDGGAVTTNDAALDHEIRVLQNYGSEVKYQNKVIGHNMRLDELQAAFLKVKLTHLMDWTARRRHIAARYQEALWGVGDLALPKTHPEATHVYHLYIIRTKHRDALQQHLADHGIGTLIHYPIPPHLQEAYAHLGYKKGDFPIAEDLAATCLSLPLWPGITDNDLAMVAEAIRGFYEGR
jgi:dTDP-4-amino-4,6-dideoxygalactose transaminase